MCTHVKHIRTHWKLTTFQIETKQNKMKGKLYYKVIHSPQIKVFSKNFKVQVQKNSQLTPIKCQKFLMWSRLQWLVKPCLRETSSGVVSKWYYITIVSNKPEAKFSRPLESRLSGSFSLNSSWALLSFVLES